MSNLEILGLPKGSSDIEIKAAYKKLVKVHHPDVKGGSSAKFILLKNAYDELLLGKMGVVTPKKEKYSYSITKDLSVIHKGGRLHKEGNMTFLFELKNTYQAVLIDELYAPYWEVNAGDIGIVANLNITKTQLESLNYEVRIRFVGYNGSYLDKKFRVRRPSPPPSRKIYTPQDLDNLNKEPEEEKKKKENIVVSTFKKFFG